MVLPATTCDNHVVAPPRALLVNPWIVDVAAYDLWARPLGLLYLAGLLRARGWEVGLIDCMDRRHPSLEKDAGRDDGHGRGKYRSEPIETPESVCAVGRRYRRYGVSFDAFDRDARAFGRPDLILITTRMTYWYPGARLAIARLRRLFAGVPIALGGVYATLCADHAAQSGADYVVRGEGENQVLALAADIAREAARKDAALGAGFPDACFDDSPLDLDRLDDLPTPAWDLAHHRDAPAVLASRGCPMNCSYCASPLLYRSHRRRDAGRVFDEIMRLARDHGAADIAFYDDALLADRQRSFEPLLDALIAAGAPVRLHTPNGLHAAFIDDALAARTRAARMETVRLSLETADAERLRRMNRATGADDFLRAMRALRGAGFERAHLGVYLLAALPGQSEDEVRRSIDLVVEAGGRPLIGEYSPIPGTPEFARAAADSGLPLEAEPLLHNNSVFHRLAPWSRDGVIDRLRRYAQTRLAAA